jgi:hypothetical protein
MSIKKIHPELFVTGNQINLSQALSQKDGVLLIQLFLFEVPYINDMEILT